MIYNGNINDIMLNIKHKMLDFNIKQNDIANKTHLTKGTISNLLNCKNKNITLDTLLMLCDAIDCNLCIDIVPKDNDLK